MAARLESIAEPGASVCQATHRQTKGKVDLKPRDLGDQRLKNIAEPVRVYAIPPASAQISAWVLPSAQAPRLSIVVLPFANLGATNRCIWASARIYEGMRKAGVPEE